MNNWRLPASLTVGGAVYAIRTDFRVVLGIFRYFKREDIPEFLKLSIAIKSLYIDADKIPQEHMQEAIERMYWYMSCGETRNEDASKMPPLMDWEQDGTLIVAAINKLVRYDIRERDMHWWTFLSFFSEIDECTFTNILRIRRKMATGKKLEDEERAYVRDNYRLVVLGSKTEERRRQDEEDRAALAAIGIT